MTALPTRKLEAYRYADVAALASVWTALAAHERVIWPWLNTWTRSGRT